MSSRPEFLARYPFEPDRFQLDAFDAFDDGEHVIVAAPTGSGKTVVAEYGVDAALARGDRAFYTAPIKALSNQKYRDFVDIYGDGRVGLLTGDIAIDGDAPLVVMTTEVLRNMMYARRDLGDLSVVVLDEVHFLQDAYRGPVWEEVIIHLPARIQLICLSATVSNAAQLADWMTAVRGPSRAIVEGRRPVHLENRYLVADRTNRRLQFLPTIVGGRPNPTALRLDASAARGRPADRRPQPTGSGFRKLATPSRFEVLDVLREHQLLPVIYFIFSRAQCDEAARACLDAGIVLTDEHERDRILAIAADRLGAMRPADLESLGYDEFVACLLAGVAAHHAGMVPPFKEVVERAFTEGLVKVVFATETLAVGINMPARSVVLDKLTKFTGDHHEALTPGQYTQLTGRAGRRGIDDAGTAVVLWSPFVRFDQVAELAQSRSFHLRSAFRPTYNMAAHLVDGYDADTARRLLSLSFAQYQADADVVRLERRIARRRERLAELREEATSPYGDLDEYRASRAARAAGRSPNEAAIGVLRPGDLIHASKGKHHGPVAVVATANRSAGMRITAVTPNGHSLYLTGDDFSTPPRPIGSVVLPGEYAPHRTGYRREVGARIRSARITRPVDRGTGERSTVGAHPVEADPDLRDRLQAAATADRVARELGELERRLGSRTGRLAAEFEAVLDILAGRGYVDRGRWRLTTAGRRLSRIFHESDLLVAEAVTRGLLDGLDAPSLAGLVSTFVYEHRSPDEPPAPWFPSETVRRRWEAIEALSAGLAEEERRAGLSVHRPPEPTFLATAHGWVSGGEFSDLLDDPDLSGGDLVRTFKQLIDLLRQVAQVADDPATAAAARRALESVHRGVVADSSAVER